MTETDAKKEDGQTDSSLPDKQAGRHAVRQTDQPTDRTDRPNRLTERETKQD